MISPSCARSSPWAARREHHGVSSSIHSGMRLGPTSAKGTRTYSDCPPSIAAAGVRVAVDGAHGGGVGFTLWQLAYRPRAQKKHEPHEDVFEGTSAPSRASGSGTDGRHLLHLVPDEPSWPKRYVPHCGCRHHPLDRDAGARAADRRQRHASLASWGARCGMCLSLPLRVAVSGPRYSPSLSLASLTCRSPCDSEGRWALHWPYVVARETTRREYKLFLCVSVSLCEISVAARACARLRDGRNDALRQSS
jgi:hypothetical protein